MQSTYLQEFSGWWVLKGKEDEDDSLVELGVSASYPMPVISTTTAEYWGMTWQPVPDSLKVILQREDAFRHRTVGFLPELFVPLPGKPFFNTPVLVVRDVFPWVVLTTEVMGENKITFCSCRACPTFPFRDQDVPCRGGIRTVWQEIQQLVVKPALEARVVCERMDYPLLQLEEQKQQPSPVSPDADEDVVSPDATFYLVSEAEGDDDIVMEEDKNVDKKNPIGKSRTARRRANAKKRKVALVKGSTADSQELQISFSNRLARRKRMRTRDRRSWPLKCYRCRLAHKVCSCPVPRVVDKNWWRTHKAVDGVWVERSPSPEKLDRIKKIRT